MVAIIASRFQSGPQCFISPPTVPHVLECDLSRRFRHVYNSARPAIVFDCSMELFENRIVSPIDERQVDSAAKRLAADRLRRGRVSAPCWQLKTARRGEEDAQ
jgi:hypothetical protein